MSRLICAFVFATVLVSPAEAARTLISPRYARRTALSWTGGATGVPNGAKIGLIHTVQIHLSNLSAVTQSITLTMKAGSDTFSTGMPTARPPFDRCIFFTNGQEKAIGSAGKTITAQQEISHDVSLPPYGDFAVQLGTLYSSNFQNAVGSTPATDVVIAIFAPKVLISVAEDRGAIQATITPNVEGVTGGNYPCLGNVTPFFAGTYQLYGSDVPLLVNGGRPF